MTIERPPSGQPSSEFSVALPVQARPHWKPPVLLTTIGSLKTPKALTTGLVALPAASVPTQVRVWLPLVRTAVVNGLVVAAAGPQHG